VRKMGLSRRRRRRIMEEPDDIHKNSAWHWVFMFVGIIHLTNGSMWSPPQLMAPPSFWILHRSLYRRTSLPGHGRTLLTHRPAW
jgi:hypothetical protein